MDWNLIEGNWREFTGHVKSKFAKLTDDDLKLVAGKRDQLLGVLQQRYGKKLEDLEKDVDDWIASFKK
jgi:uncharacterized protein YjbJ (UPF0337 family)